MYIAKPVGAKLPNCVLPGGSFVNAEIVEGPDGLKDIRLHSAHCKSSVDVSISDLNCIINWAQRP